MNADTASEVVVRVLRSLRPDRPVRYLGDASLYDAAFEQLRKFGALDGTALNDVGWLMLAFLDHAEGLDPRYARVLAAAVAEQCLPQAMVACAILSQRRSLLLRAKDIQHSVFHDAHRTLSRYEDRSDVERLVRTYRTIESRVAEAPGTLEAIAAELGVDWRVFQSARATVTRLQAAASHFRLVGQRADAPYDALVHAFMAGFGESLLAEHSWDSRRTSLHGNSLRLSEEGVNYMSGRMLLPVQTIELPARRGYTFTLATATMEVDVKHIERHFKERMSVELWGFRFDETAGTVKCSQCYKIDNEAVYREFGEAPNCVETWRYLANAILAGMPFTQSLFGGLDRLQRVVAASTRPGSRVQAPQSWQLECALHQKGADSAGPVEITWTDLEAMTGQTALENQVALVEQTHPQELTVASCNLPVVYGTTGIIFVNVELSKGHQAALDKITVGDLPSAWDKQSVRMIVNNGPYRAGSTSGELTDHQLDALRRQVAVKLRKPRSIYLPHDAKDVFVEVTVQHPGRKENLFVVFGELITVPEADQALKEAQRRLRAVLSEEARQAVAAVFTESGSEPEPAAEQDIAAAVQPEMMKIAAKPYFITDEGFLAEIIAAVRARASQPVRDGVEARRRLRDELRSTATALQQCARDARQHGRNPSVNTPINAALALLGHNRPAAFAPSQTSLDQAYWLLAGAQQQLPYSESDRPRLLLRARLEALRKQAADAGVRSLSREAVDGAVNPIAQQLTAEKFDSSALAALTASIDAATIVVADACRNPQGLRGGCSGTKPGKGLLRR